MAAAPDMADALNEARLQLHRLGVEHARWVQEHPAEAMRALIGAGVVSVGVFEEREPCRPPALRLEDGSGTAFWTMDARVAVVALDDLEYRQPEPRPVENPGRRFLLHRIEDETGVSGCGIVAWGYEFPDGPCVTRWCVTEIRQISVWASIEEVEAIHGHNGKTKVVWLDD